MVAFLNKDRSYSEIVDIVSKASGRLVLISPYVKIQPDLLERLKYMDGKGTKTTLVCRGDDLSPEVRSELRELKNLDLRFDEHLHAKCFYNEESMVITSLNLYTYSQQNNREMGILLKLKEDATVFNEALSEAEFIIERARKVQAESAVETPKRVTPKPTGTRAREQRQESAVDKPKDTSVLGSIVRGVRSVVKELNAESDSATRRASKTSKQTPRQSKKSGYCIRCGKTISFGIDKPYCLPCARAWNKAGGHNDRREKQCHQCGSKVSTITYGKPVCGSCYFSK